MTTSDIITRLKQNIAKNSFPPTFPDRKWENKWISEYTNCLAYALNCTYPDKTGQKIYGALLENLKSAPYYEDSEIEAAFESFLQMLDISYRRVENVDYNLKNHYQAALCNEKDGKDFHVIRQDDSGAWSHKSGWDEPPTVLCTKDGNPGEEIKKYGYRIILYYYIRFS